MRAPEIRDLWKEGLEPRRNFQTLDWSLQVDHIHLTAEAMDSDAMTRGLMGMASSFARRLNRLIGKRGGRVFDHRHDSRVLMTVDSVDRAIYYVHNNWKKHGLAPWATRALDEYSSASEHEAITRRARTAVVRHAASRYFNPLG